MSPLPLLLYACFWVIIMFIGSLLFAAFFIYVFSNQITSMHKPPAIIFIIIGTIDIAMIGRFG